MNDIEFLKRFFRTAKEMRRYQRQYFKHRDNTSLSAARSAEKQLDKMIKSIEEPKLF